MKSFICDKKDFEIGAEFDRKPIKVVRKLYEKIYCSDAKGGIQNFAKAEGGEKKKLKGQQKDSCNNLDERDQKHGQLFQNWLEKNESVMP